MGKFNPSGREDFILIPSKYTTVENKMYLRKETLDAFLKMQIAADKDKINLKIASATRNFDYQKSIWNNKWTGVTLEDGKNLSKLMRPINELRVLEKSKTYKLFSTGSDPQMEIDLHGKNFQVAYIFVTALIT